MRRSSSACSSRRRASADALIEELQNEAANTVHFEDGELVIDHMYIERRMTPLNLYIRNASREDAERAVLDYGQCIRDLAVTNIFAGDLLLKNFGVTRHGRVIFYDYDELCAVTDCRFRDIPQAQQRRRRDARRSRGSTSTRTTCSPKRSCSSSASIRSSRKRS